MNKNAKSSSGCTHKITHNPSAKCPSVSKLVLNNCYDIAITLCFDSIVRYANYLIYIFISLPLKVMNMLLYYLHIASFGKMMCHSISLKASLVL